MMLSSVTNTIKTLSYVLVAGIIILISSLYIISDVEPVIWQPDPPRSLEGLYAKNNRLDVLIPILPNQGNGPEDMALGPDGMIYTAYENGDIVMFDPAGGPKSKRPRSGSSNRSAQRRPCKAASTVPGG